MKTHTVHYCVRAWLCICTVNLVLQQLVAPPPPDEEVSSYVGNLNVIWHVVMMWYIWNRSSISLVCRNITMPTFYSGAWAVDKPIRKKCIFDEQAIACFHAWNWIHLAFGGEEAIWRHPIWFWINFDGTFSETSSTYPGLTMTRGQNVEEKHETETRTAKWHAQNDDAWRANTSVKSKHEKACRALELTASRAGEPFWQCGQTHETHERNQTCSSRFWWWYFNQSQLGSFSYLYPQYCYQKDMIIDSHV